MKDRKKILIYTYNIYVILYSGHNIVETDGLVASSEGPMSLADNTTSQLCYALGSRTDVCLRGQDQLACVHAGNSHHR